MRIVATMASLSTRQPLLERVVGTLLPQVDALCVYLNGYEKIPSFLVHPKVLHPILSKEAGWRGAEAKLWFWDRDEFRAAPYWSEDDVAIICDDDILYPPDYVARMVDALDRRPGSIACVHGSVLQKPFERYATSRWVASARGFLERDTQVHLPGTGTMAFRRGSFDVNLRRDISWNHSVDVHVGIAAKAQGVAVWSVARPERWLHPLPLPTGTSVFRQRTGAGNESVETDLIKAAAPWPPLRATSLGFRSKRLGPSPPAMNSIAMMPREIAPWIAERVRGRRGYFVELGSGYGTAVLSEALGPDISLVSVEHDPKFVGLVDGTRYIHAPLHGRWYDRNTLKAQLPKENVVGLLIDGPPGRIGRAGVIKNLDLFPSDVPIVMDDVHRPAERSLLEELASLRGQTPTIHECSGGRAFASLGWEGSP